MSEMSPNDIRVEIYRSFIQDRRAPMAVEVAHRLGLPRRPSWMASGPFMTRA